MKQNRTKGKIIGLTGGIASGKSTVSRMLLSKEFPVVDADKIARDVVEIGQPAYKQILRQFGEGILREDGTINRQKLGNIIFNDKTLRLRLNEIVHPRVTEAMVCQIHNYLKVGPVVFVDIPLLFEVKQELERDGLKFDEIWVVYTGKEEQIQRLMGREGIERDEAIKRIKSQMPLEEKKRLADRIIDNTKGMENLEQSLEKLIRAIRL